MFKGKVIKLNEADYAAWEKRFTNIDLNVLLTKQDEWYSQQGIKNWFMRLERYLHNANERSRFEYRF